MGCISNMKLLKDSSLLSTYFVMLEVIPFLMLTALEINCFFLVLSELNDALLLCSFCVLTKLEMQLYSSNLVPQVL